MNKQEIFDASYLGLASQGFQQSKIEDVCQYRGPEGRKCAAGWLVSDDEYNPDWEDNVVEMLPYFTSKYSTEELEVLQSVQRAHDGTFMYAPEIAGARSDHVLLSNELSISPEQMQSRLEAVAKWFGLTVPTVVSN